MKPYELEDEAENSSLTITASTAGDCPVAAVCVSGENGYATAHVEPSAVPGAALALYEAAGLPVPVILPRPLDLPIGTAEHNTVVAGYYLWLENGRVCIDERLLNRDIEPADARQLAAAIAVHAEAAAGTYSAEVQPLAVEIHRAQCNTSVVPDPCDRCRETARNVLLGGWKRETQA